MTESRLRLLIWILSLAWVLAPRSAHAIEYEAFVDVDDEEDLYDLQVTGQISDSTFEQLVDLLRRGTDLNTATRDQLYALPNLNYEDVDAILAYREDAGYIPDPAALVVAGALTRRKLNSIAAFLIVPDKEGKRTAVRGFARYRTVWTSGDRRVPPMAAQARVSTLRHLTVGAAGMLNRNDVAPVHWDPNRDGFITSGTRIRPRAAKYFAMWDTPKWGIIAGTYSIGFGQRLVFDTSRRYTPNGFYLDDTLYRRTDLTLECKLSTGELTQTPCPYDEPRNYVTPDYDFQERLRGVAVGAKHVKLPVGWLQAYGFVSHQNKSIYQYEIWNQDACADPRVPGDIDEACKAPPVYVPPEDDLLASSPVTSYQTLPNMYQEITGGANFGYWYNNRTHVGVTGYGATTDWLVDGVNLSFQDAARTPYGGPWGAAGADASWGRSWADLFVEVAHSFDSIEPDGGGGPAAIVMHTAAWKTHEIEVSGRYYDTKYANPYARPISAADEQAGLRASDEAGGRIRYNTVVAKIVNVRSSLDVWGELSQAIPKLQVFVRTDVQATEWIRPGLWVEYQSRDLQATGRDRCYDQGFFGSNGGADTTLISASSLEYGSSVACNGERVKLTGRVRFDPHKKVYFDLQYRHDFTDDNAYTNRMRQDSMFALVLGSTPIDPLRLRFRLRYDNDDISNRARLEETLWAYLEVAYKVRYWFQPSLRYDIRAWLDARDSTALRRPNPEHWIHLQVESKF